MLYNYFEVKMNVKHKFREQEKKRGAQRWQRACMIGARREWAPAASRSD